MDEIERRRHLDELYSLVAELAQVTGGARRLGTATGRDGWPRSGVYLVFEDGELREDGRTPRVVRVGTHALTATSSTTLWTRLRQHRGTVGGRNPGGGNHRGSIFRLHVGTALLDDPAAEAARETWGMRSSAPRDVRDREIALERRVSEVIGAMDVLVLDVPDRHERAQIEQGAIALLSNHNRPPIDPPSPSWLGHSADRQPIRESGLWNVNHVADRPTAAFLDLVRAAVDRSTTGAADR